MSSIARHLIYKLSTGENFIGENVLEQLEETDNKFVSFKNPLYVSFNPTPNGVNVGFMPWGDFVYVKKENIISYTEPQSELEDQYVQLTTGIQLAH
jgi:hypothetical protein